MTQLIIIGNLSRSVCSAWESSPADSSEAPRKITCSPVIRLVPFCLLMSLFGTTMTAFALVGSSGEAFKEGVGVYGMLASSSGIIHSLCFFLIGVKLWGFGKKYGYTTPDSVLFGIDLKVTKSVCCCFPFWSASSFPICSLE